MRRRSLALGASLLAAALVAAPATAVAQAKARGTSAKAKTPVRKGNKAKKPGRKAAPAPAPAAPALPKLETWTLDNGLEVAFVPVRTAPVVTVHVWYHAGSKDEERDKRGSAHMFEHMMFKGTEHVRPEQHARHVQRLGGSVNAFTTQDATAFHNTLPAEYLGFACQLEAERMRNLLFRDEMIDTEREVVKEEIRQADNNPLQKAVLELFDAMFTKHPYAWTAGGDAAGLERTNKQYLQDFYDRYYVPNNALLVVVGDADRGAVERCANEHFASIPKSDEPERKASPGDEPEQTQRRNRTEAPAQLGVKIGGYRIPGARHEDVYALQVLQTILSGGESSRLHGRLVRDDKVAVAATGSNFVLEHPGVFGVFAAFLAPDQADKVEAAMLDEVAKLRSKAPSAREVRKAKNQLLAGYVFGLESVNGLAQQVGLSWINTGNPGHWRGDIAGYEAVTPADVQRVASTYLTEDKLTLVTIPPGGSAAGGAQ